MELSKLKQRLELLYQEVEKLEAEGGGGGGGDSYTKAQTDALLAEKADKSDVYTKSNTYNKTEVNSQIGSAIADLDVSQTATTGHYIDYIAQEDGLIVPHAKVSSTVPTTDDSTLITSGAVAAALANKADKSTTYTKDEVDASQAVQNTEIGTLANRGAKNLAKFDIWEKNCSIVRGTKTINNDGSITITATSSDCYTLFSPTDFPVECRIPVTPGTEMVATWTSSETGTGNKYIYFFPNGGASGSIAVKASDGIKRFTIPAGCDYLTWRIGCSTSGDTLTINNLMVCTAADYDASNAYIPYAPTNRQLYVSQTGYTAESANGSFSALLHNAATYCGVDDSQEVNGFVIFTSSVASENLIGFFNFKYLRNVAFSPVISNTITYSAQSQYGTVTVTGGTGPYKAVVKFI